MTILLVLVGLSIATAYRCTLNVLSVVLLSGLSELDFDWREVENADEDSLAQRSAR